MLSALCQCLLHHACDTQLPKLFGTLCPLACINIPPGIHPLQPPQTPKLGAEMSFVCFSPFNFPDLLKCIGGSSILDVLECINCQKVS